MSTASFILDFFMNNLEPRIYVACLAAYNNGFLHGEWINANQDTDSLYSDVKNMLAASPIPSAEELRSMILKGLVTFA